MQYPLCMMSFTRKQSRELPRQSATLPGTICQRPRLWDDWRKKDMNIDRSEIDYVMVEGEDGQGPVLACLLPSFTMVITSNYWNHTTLA